jgi:hypothetical protein
MEGILRTEKGRFVACIRYNTNRPLSVPSTGPGNCSPFIEEELGQLGHSFLTPLLPSLPPPLSLPPPPPFPSSFSDAIYEPSFIKEELDHSSLTPLPPPPFPSSPPPSPTLLRGAVLT